MNILKWLKEHDTFVEGEFKRNFDFTPREMHSYIKQMLDIGLITKELREVEFKSVFLPRPAYLILYKVNKEKLDEVFSQFRVLVQ